MVFIRQKCIKGRMYHYLCESTWTDNGSRQKVIKYLGAANNKDYPTILRNSIIDHFKKCNYCNSTNDLTIDHIMPLSKEGKHIRENLQCLCSSCNLKKRNTIIT